MSNLQTISRVALASVLTSGLTAFGVAACAQTAPAPNTATAATIAAPATAAVAATAPSSATNVSMSTSATKTDRRAELDAVNSEARRVAFRHLGFNL